MELQSRAMQPTDAIFTKRDLGRTLLIDIQRKGIAKGPLRKHRDTL